MFHNFIIFYAIVNLFHQKLLRAYHESMKEDNLIAENAIRYQAPTAADSTALNRAAENLNNLDNMGSVADGISMITKFFEGVISALPDKNAAADDILPAVCDGISRCRTITSHVVSP